MELSFSDFAAKIKAATTKGELGDISYLAFRQDNAPFNKKNSLYNKVTRLCIQREVELGLL